MRRVLVTLVAAATMLAGAACGAEKAASPGQPDKVNVGVIAIADVAPIYLGKDKGFFSSRNIDLTLTTAQGGAAIVPAVVGGQYQFGFSNTISLLLAQSRNLPLKVVCNGNSSTGVDGQDFAGLFVKADSPIRSPKDLAGKTVAANTLNNIVDTTVRASVRKDGGEASAVKFVELPFPDQGPHCSPAGSTPFSWSSRSSRRRSPRGPGRSRPAMSTRHRASPSPCTSPRLNWPAETPTSSSGSVRR
ncbi:hypothetical protein Vqi01_17610 [Micromonospora qiuiae]|uniref:Thiamine pyrimidine synthase n=1 Tax=Micromonospora qiuiae TaxID=502268 RepID=A0ABQ4J8V1_9ACTN|nr:hypothetical protein Vqi01_17610 [Micromonospora qiuiae]